MDLAGGTLDIWPLGLLHPGARTVNVAIDLEVCVTLSPRPGGYRIRQGERLLEATSADGLTSHPDGKLIGVVAAELGLPACEARLESQSPRGAGLGASSATMVAALAAGHAWRGEPSPPPAFLARMARDLEARMMGLPTGLQDHYPALLGGALEILHRPGGECVRRLQVDLRALGRHLLIVDSGQSHFSAGTNWQIVRRRLEGDPETTSLLGAIAEVAAEVPTALETGDFERVGKLLGREWSFRRHLAEEVATPAIESLLQLANSLGAWGGKVCGAGGGGCVALLAPEERLQRVAEALRTAGAEVIRAQPSAFALRCGATEDQRS